MSVKFKFTAAASMSAASLGVKGDCGHGGEQEEEVVEGGWVVHSLWPLLGLLWERGRPPQ